MFEAIIDKFPFLKVTPFGLTGKCPNVIDFYYEFQDFYPEVFEDEIKLIYTGCKNKENIAEQFFKDLENKTFPFYFSLEVVKSEKNPESGVNHHDDIFHLLKTRKEQWEYGHSRAFDYMAKKTTHPQSKTLDFMKDNIKGYDDLKDFTEDVTHYNLNTEFQKHVLEHYPWSVAYDKEKNQYYKLLHRGENNYSMFQDQYKGQIKSEVDYSKEHSENNQQFPINSFTTNLRTARIFGKDIHSLKVPLNHIHFGFPEAYNNTNLGHEHEYLVEGDKLGKEYHDIQQDPYEHHLEVNPELGSVGKTGLFKPTIKTFENSYPDLSEKVKFAETLDHPFFRSWLSKNSKEVHDALFRKISQTLGKRQEVHQSHIDFFNKFEELKPLAEYLQKLNVTKSEILTKVVKSDEYDKSHDYFIKNGVDNYEEILQKMFQDKKDNSEDFQNMIQNGETKKFKSAYMNLLFEHYPYTFAKGTSGDGFYKKMGRTGKIGHFQTKSDTFETTNPANLRVNLYDIHAGFPEVFHPKNKYHSNTYIVDKNAKVQHDPEVDVLHHFNDINAETYDKTSHGMLIPTPQQSADLFLDEYPLYQNVDFANTLDHEPFKEWLEKHQHLVVPKLLQKVQNQFLSDIPKSHFDFFKKFKEFAPISEYIDGQLGTSKPKEDGINGDDFRYANVYDRYKELSDAHFMDDHIFESLLHWKNSNSKSFERLVASGKAEKFQKAYHDLIKKHFPYTIAQNENGDYYKELFRGQESKIDYTKVNPIFINGGEVKLQAWSSDRSIADMFAKGDDAQNHLVHLDDIHAGYPEMFFNGFYGSEQEYLVSHNKPKPEINNWDEDRSRQKQLHHLQLKPPPYHHMANAINSKNHNTGFLVPRTKHESAKLFTDSYPNFSQEVLFHKTLNHDHFKDWLKENHEEVVKQMSEKLEKYSNARPHSSHIDFFNKFEELKPLADKFKQ